MNIKKILASFTALMLSSTVVMAGQAATDTKEAKTNDSAEKPAVKEQAPIVIDADKLSYSDATGDIFADGNVVVTKSPATILTDSMRGNTKKTEVWIDGKATLTQPGTQLVGTNTDYNYTNKTGTMKNATGTVDKEHINGDNLQILPNELIIHDGTVTQCPANDPCYHISAEKVEIWPGDKLIAYNAKFWIENMVIYSMPKYQISLKKGQMADQFPRVGYNSDDGIYIRQYLESPIGDKVAAFADLGYYSKNKFKSNYGLIDREKNYSLSLIQGEYNDSNYNSNNNWIKKEPELDLNYYSHRLGKLPVSYTFNASYGKWDDGTKESWHQDYNLYFTHDTIKLSDSLSLDLGTGLEYIHESYDGSSQNIFRLNSTLSKTFSPKFSAWMGYNYTKNNQGLFEYDSTDLTRELTSGISYKIDRLDSISYSQSYDLQNNELHSKTYTWNRDLHCWQLAISYKPMDNPRITFSLSTTKW